MVASVKTISSSVLALFVISAPFSVAKEGNTSEDRYFNLSSQNLGGSREVQELIHRGHVRLLDGDGRKALSAFNAALRMDPRSGAAYIGRGRAYFSLGAYGPAFGDLKKAVECGPEPVSVGALWDSAFLHRELNQYDLSQKEFNELLQKQSLTKVDRSWALMQLAECYQRQGKFDLALTPLAQALKVNPDNHYARFIRSISYMALNKPDMALADLDTAIKDEAKERHVVFSEEAVRYHQRRAEIYKKLNKPELAKKDEEYVKKVREDVFDIVPFRVK